MEISKGNIFKLLFNPLIEMCQKLKHEFNEQESDICFDLFKQSIQQIWQNICIKLDQFENVEINNFLQIDQIIIQFSNEKTDDFLFLIEKYNILLQKYYLVKVCLTISLLECFNSDIKSLKQKPKKDYLIRFFKEKSDELSKSSGLNVFLLCIHQIEVCLVFLLNVFVNEHTHKLILKESRQYIVERIEWCLNFLSNESIENTFYDHPDSGSFIQLMDTVLDLIVNINAENVSKEDMVKTYTVTKGQIDQILCQAITIGQIALPYDSASIKAGCQKILAECDELSTQLNKNDLDVSLFNLLVDSLSNSLCSLEERVNIGVLKLLLEVFKNYDENLQKLEDVCKNPLNKMSERSVNDLNDLITSFDIQTERIIQIGLFAVTCSTHKHRVLRMRSCLASLESLEKELVPALSIYYIEQTQKSQLHAQLLIKHWRDSINLLQDLIHLIVDPVAFTQVVIDSCSDKLNNIVPTKNSVVVNVNSICLECNLFSRHLKISLPEIYETTPDDLKKQKDIFLHLLNECNCATEQWLNSDNSISHKSVQSLLKRFKLMIRYLKKLSHSLANSCKQDENISDDSHEVSQLSIRKRDEILNNVPTNRDEILKKMMTLALKGEQIRKERSILYQTPRKTVKIVAFHPKNQSQISNRSRYLMSMSKTQFARKISRESVQLDVTDILENISNLELSS